MGERRTVFISHANPDDNEFASWLGSRLAGAGYEVWADLLSLVGGEMISPVIDDVIRDDAAIVIVVLSQASHRKEGVLNELALASAVGRDLCNPQFVLPVVVDGLPRTEFPGELVGRLSINDFERDWADGLRAVLTALEELGTPRDRGRADEAMVSWLAYKARGSVLRKDEPDMLYSNWFKLGPLPRCICFSAFSPGSEIDSAFERFQWPARRFHRLAISFADADALMSGTPGVRLQPRSKLDLGDFLAGRKVAGVPQVLGREARNILIDLLHQAWGMSAQRQGLLRRELVAGDCWFVPRGLYEKDRGHFIDDDGKPRRRQLAGHSAAKKVDWHFGVSARVTIAEPRHFALRSHVVFSVDGEPLGGRRAQLLRRSFCKSWWNARWRDMLLGFVANLAGDWGQVKLLLSPDAVLPMSTTPMRLQSPVWVADDDAANSDEEAQLSDHVSDLNGGDDGEGQP